MEETGQQSQDTNFPAPPAGEIPPPTPATDSSTAKEQADPSPHPLQPETSNTQPSTQNMETHAHHLHHAPGKKFWHYFYEFLMLFLAVFCGFLAENFREHQLEKEKGKQYIRSFYTDLKEDTAKLSGIITFDDQKVPALNTMFTCYDTVLKNWKSSSCMWSLVQKTNYNRHFQQTDRTLKQLANAGGFRLLQGEDADSIARYETEYKTIEDFQSTVFQEAQDNVRATMNRLVDFKSVSQLRSTLTGADTTGLYIKTPLLLSDDKALLNKYFNELLMYLRVINGHRNQMERFMKRATGLISYFKNKYNLE
ncbi:MAG: hypothetical protein Q8941_08335 [Bacteroidota bacterium]|nr:hypothetical protein [Bacteroidota bacterium]